MVYFFISFQSATSSSQLCSTSRVMAACTSGDKSLPWIVQNFFSCPHLTPTFSMKKGVPGQADKILKIASHHSSKQTN